MSTERDYEVGKGKPPKATRFQKGRSGNPAGRPRASRNLTTIIETEMSRKVRINENGRSRSLTKLEILVKRLVADSLSGKPRALAMLLGLYEKAFGFAPETASRENLPVDDKAILEDYARSLIAGLGGSDD